MKLSYVAFLLGGFVSAQAQSLPQTLDKRYIFDPQIKDPIQIVQVLSGLAREEDAGENNRRALALLQTTLDRSIGRIRNLQLVDPVSQPVSASLRDVLRASDKNSDPAVLSPFANEFEKVLAAVKNIQGARTSLEDAIAELINIRHPKVVQLRSRPKFQGGCDVDELDEMLKDLRAVQPISISRIREVNACIAYVQNPPKIEQIRLTYIAELEGG